MLFHSFVTNTLILIMRVVKPMGGWRILLLTLVRQRCFYVVFVLIRSWSLVVMFDLHKIRFFSMANSNFVDFISISWLVVLILTRNLLLHLGDTRWQVKSLMLVLRVFIVMENLIIRFRAITCHRWRRSALKIYCSLREPSKVCPWLERPIWIRFFRWISYFVTNQRWQIVVTSTCLIEICVHGLH